MDKYFNLNRTLLLIVGLWPYKKSISARLQYICIFSIFTTFLIFQLTSFTTSKCTADLIIKIFSSVLAVIIVEIKYISFYVNSEAVKHLIEYLQCSYNNLKDRNEIVIIEKYLSKGRCYTTSLMTLLVTLGFVHIVLQLLPNFYGIILSINGSHQRRLHVVTEYFIDQEKYFYLLLLHMYISYYIGLCMLIATGTSLIICFQYVCGMFKIASYRIDNAMKIYVSQNILQNDNLLHKNIIYAIDIQRKAIMFTDYIVSKFEVTFMFLVVLAVLALSFNIFRIISSEFNVEEFSLPYLSTVTCVVYMFIANYVGQEITEHYNYVFDMTYKGQWYLAPLHIQKLILFLIQRGNKAYGLSIGGLVVASLECFASLTNTSISYFIVMYSVQM